MLLKHVTIIFGPAQMIQWYGMVLIQQYVHVVLLNDIAPWNLNKVYWPSSLIVTVMNKLRLMQMKRSWFNCMSTWSYVTNTGPVSLWSYISLVEATGSCVFRSILPVYVQISYIWSWLLTLILPYLFNWFTCCTSALGCSLILLFWIYRWYYGLLNTNVIYSKQ